MDSLIHTDIVNSTAKFTFVKLARSCGMKSSQDTNILGANNNLFLKDNQDLNNVITIG